MLPLDQSHMHVLVITTLKEFVIVKWIRHFTPDCFQKKTWENFYLVSCLTQRLWETSLLMSQPQPAWHKLTQIHNIYIIYCTAVHLPFESTRDWCLQLPSQLLFFYNFFSRGVACDIRAIRGLCSSALPMTDMCLGHGRFRDLTPEPSRAWC